MIRDAFINGIAFSAIRQRLFKNRDIILDQAYDQANALICVLRHSLAHDGNFDDNVVAVAPKSLLKTPNETSHHSTEVPVSAVSRDPPSENDKKVRASFVEILRIIQENGVQHETLFLLIVKGRAIFKRFVKVKRKQNQRLRTSIDQSRCVIQSAPSCLAHAIMTATINNHEVSVIIDSGSSLRPKLYQEEDSCVTRSFCGII